MFLSENLPNKEKQKIILLVTDRKLNKYKQTTDESEEILTEWWVNSEIIILFNLWKWPLFHWEFFGALLTSSLNIVFKNDYYLTQADLMAFRTFLEFLQG